jgi:hypothetical protein
MATTGSSFRELLARARTEVPPATWEEPEDLTRYSREALIAQVEGDARVERSEGRLRLSGQGVSGHAIDLEDVGSITLHWQRAVSAIGASLEDVRTARGTLPAHILQRTRMRLIAAPGAGSVVLRVAPSVDALVEAEPGGSRPLVDPPRPLADRASEALIELLGKTRNAGMAQVDSLGSTLRDHGPRVASALQGLAVAIASASVNFDVAWTEPGAPTLRAAWSPGDAEWIRKFIDGRELTSDTEPFTGTVATVSDRERWLVESGDEVARIDAAAIPLQDVRKVRPGDEVTLNVKTTRKYLPDGSVRTSRVALSLVEVRGMGGADRS